jgi:hypothetical protein
MIFWGRKATTATSLDTKLLNEFQKLINVFYRYFANYHYFTQPRFKFVK